MLTRLLPKEGKYFEHFTEIIAHIKEMATLTSEMFTSEHYNVDIILKMKPLENRCDDIASKVVKQMNKTFVTPFDREDIFTLIKRLDDISDILFAACVRVEMFGLKERLESADKLTAIIMQQIRELELAITDLKDKAKSMNECKAVKDLETQADTIYQAAMTKLFQVETDPIELIKKKEILDILETASDKCQGVANVIISIFLKNS